MSAPPRSPRAWIDRVAAHEALLVRIGFGVLLVVGAAFLLRETRGTTFWFDDWQWIVERRDHDLRTFLAPHNGHFAVVPLLLYKALYALAGLDSFLPYRVLVIAVHLVSVVLLFVYANRRVGPYWALLAAGLLLTFGPGWQTILWPFQVTWLLSLVGVAGALLALDRRDLRGDLAASALLSLALTSSSIGLPIAVGLVVEVVRTRSRRDLWIVGVPLVLFALLWVGYQDSGGFERRNVVLALRFASDVAAGTLSALVGMSSPIAELGGGEDPQVTLGWGRPLLILALVALAWRLSRIRPVPTRVLSLLVMIGVFCLLLGLQRAQTGTPIASRYLHVVAILVLLLVVELARGARLPRGAGAVVAGVAAVAIAVANLGDMRSGARFLRAQADLTRAELGALELARADVRPESLAEGLPGYPLVVLPVRDYFAAAEELGTPAADVADLAGGREEARAAADAELRRLQGVGLRPGGGNTLAGAPPRVDGSAGGRIRALGSCVSFSPDPVAATTAVAQLSLTVPATGLGLRTAGGGEAGVALRRFASAFPAEAPERLASGGAGMVRPGRDAAPQPWHVRLTPRGSVTACGIR